MKGCDAVLHLAALIAIPFSYHSPDTYVDTNIKGTLNVLQAARELGVIRVIHTSTSEVYGDPEVHPQQETYWGHVNPIGIRSCYDEGKRCAETLFFDYHRQNGVDIRVVRIFNTYGPRMLPDDGRVVSNFIVQALRGEDLTIYGDGTQTRSFCYVDDLIAGFVRLRVKGRPGAQVTVRHAEVLERDGWQQSDGCLYHTAEHSEVLVAVLAIP